MEVQLGTAGFIRSQGLIIGCLILEGILYFWTLGGTRKVYQSGVGIILDSHRIDNKEHIGQSCMVDKLTSGFVATVRTLTVAPLKARHMLNSAKRRKRPPCHVHGPNKTWIQR